MSCLFVWPAQYSIGSDADFGQFFTQSRTVGVCRQIVIECFSCEFAAGWTDSRKILQLCGCCLIAFPRWIVTQRADNVLLQSHARRKEPPDDPDREAVADLFSEISNDLAPNSSFSPRERTYLELTKKSTLPDLMMKNLSPTSP